MKGEYNSIHSLICFSVEQSSRSQFSNIVYWWHYLARTTHTHTQTKTCRETGIGSQPAQFVSLGMWPRALFMPPCCCRHRLGIDSDSDVVNGGVFLCVCHAWCATPGIQRPSSVVNRWHASRHMLSLLALTTTVVVVAMSTCLAHFPTPPLLLGATSVLATTLSMLPCRRRGCPTPQPQSDFLPTDFVIFAENRSHIGSMRECVTAEGWGRESSREGAH